MNNSKGLNAFVSILCALNLLTNQVKLESVPINQNLAPTSFAPSYADLDKSPFSSIDAESESIPHFRKPRSLPSWVSKVGMGLLLGWGVATGTPALPFITPAIAQEPEEKKPEDLTVQELVAGVKKDLYRIRRTRDEAEALEYEIKAIEKIRELENRKELTTLNPLFSFLDFSMLDYNKHVAVFDALIDALYQIIQAHQEEKTVIRINFGSGKPLFYHDAVEEVDGRSRRSLIEVPVRDVVPIILKEIHRRLVLQYDFEELKRSRQERERRKEAGETVYKYEDHLNSRITSQLFRLEAKLVRNKIIPFNPQRVSLFVQGVDKMAKIPEHHSNDMVKRLVYGLIQAIGDYPVDSKNLKISLDWLTELDKTAKFNGYWDEKREITDTEYLTQLYIKEARQKLASRITEEELPLPTEKIDDPQPQEPVKAKEEGEEIKSGGPLQTITLIILSLIASLLAVGGVWKKIKENRRLNKTDIKKSSDLKILVPKRKKENFTGHKLAKLFAAKGGKPFELGDFYIPNNKPRLDSTGKNLIYQALNKRTGQPTQILETGRFLIDLSPFDEHVGFRYHRAWDWGATKPITVREFQGFIIIGELGKGAMGEVLRAWDPAKQSTVAIKLIQIEALDDESVKRFKREIEIMGSMKNHPNIVQIHKAGIFPLLYFVMDEIDGVPFDAILHQHITLPVPDVIEIGIQTAKGLKIIHENNIVHRDIKPENLFLTRAGFVQIADFGIGTITNKTRLSVTGQLIGTPVYMSPEQPSGLVDGRTDIYALGLILYEALTGQRPFKTDGGIISILANRVEQDKHDAHKKIREHRPDLPLGMDDIVRKAMAYNVEDRYQTADELIQDLEALKANPAIRFDVKVHRSAKKKAQMGLAIGVPIFLLAAYGLSRWILQRSAPTKEVVQENPNEIDKRDHPLYLLPEKINQIRNSEDPAQKRESYQAALEELNKAKEDFPDLEENPLFHFYRGLIQGGMGNFSGMSEEFRLFKEKANKTLPNDFYEPLKKAEELEERMRLLDLISDRKTPIELPQIPPFEVAA